MAALAFTLGPFNRDALAEGLNQFAGDGRERWFAHHFHSAVVDFEGVVEPSRREASETAFTK